MRQTLEDIADLAEFIAEENFTWGSVNLEKIARNRDIELHYDFFGNYFTGMLQYEDDTFDIYVNLEKVKNKKYARARFTVAHELGHYFIDHHRSALKRGKSLSYDKELHYFSNDPIEKEANHFATNLLMPQERFIKVASSMEIGIDAVQSLSRQFKTSITSTAIQYQNLVNYPCGLLFWDNQQGFRRKNYSDSLYNMVKRFSPNFHVQSTLKAEIFDEFTPFFNTTETSKIVTNLSALYPDVTVKGSADLNLKVETMNLQSFGYLSLIFVNK